MQRVNNMGSLLQAYALKKIINSFGSEVVFVDIEQRPEDHKTICGAIYDHTKESDRGKKIDRFFFKRLSNKIKCQRQNKEYEGFRIKELDVQEEREKRKLDACLIGSDEVFNCLSPSPWGLTSQLFGKIENVNNVFTYAASCGATKYEDLPEEARLIIRDALANLKGISVRDNNTANFAGKAGRDDSVKHLDPVLIYDFEEEAKRYKSVIRRLPNRYCIVYSYQNRIHNQEEIDCIKRFAKENDYTLLSIGQSQFWLPKHQVMHPFEVINAFIGAEYVITDTFHGCILAAKYSKDFSVITRKSNENKLLDLVSTIGIEDHVIQNMNNLAIHMNVDKFNLRGVLDYERERTHDYLKEMLFQT